MSATNLNDGHTQRATTWLTPAVRAEFESEGWWTSQTWIDLVMKQVEAAPDKLAVIDETGSLTRGESMFGARRLAAYLYSRGIRPGDVVTLVLPNWREFVLVHTAIGLVGGVINPLLPKIQQSEMTHIMRTAGTTFVFAAAELRGSSPWQLACCAAEGIRSVKEVVPVRGGANSLEDILAHPWEDVVSLPEVRPDPSAWDTVSFTSGTESLPKGVVHSHQTTMFGLRSYIGEVLGLTANDCLFMPSPLCHASGLQWGLRASIYTGATLVIQDRWDAEKALQLIDRHACTFTLAATPFIVDMVGQRAVGRGAGSSLRYVASGGTAIPRHLVQDVREAFGAELMAVFGSSETYVSTATRPGSPDRMLASDGRALPGVQVLVVDETGAPVPTDVEGEIVSRGPQVFVGYLGDPDLTHRAFRGEWYRFGDLGRIDGDGMLHVTGRIKDIVIRGGENISVREVEELLMIHPDVDSVAVVGYPDPRLGERCCAMIVSARPDRVGLADLSEFLLANGLAKFKLPERVEVVEEMPMTATGKIRKAELRRRLLVEFS